MKKLTVNVDKGYDILIEKGITAHCGEYISKISKAKKVCIISDTNVFLSTVRALRFRLKQADLMFMNIFSLPVKAQKNLPK